MAQWLLSPGSWGLAIRVAQGRDCLVGDGVALLRVRGALQKLFRHPCRATSPPPPNPQARREKSLPLPPLGFCVCKFRNSLPALSHCELLLCPPSLNPAVI